jgi:tRNA modification GTPase
MKADVARGFTSPSVRGNNAALTRVMNISEDTIAAISTAPGEAGVSIVRISGADSLRVADAVFKGPPPCPSGRSTHIVVHGHVTDKLGHLDEVLLVVMRGPHSYTGEDVVEIQGHGGNIAARRILRRVLDAGARMAEPGEFTKRAFLNGRMDLVQAEAVLDLVRARSDRAASAAMEQLEGGLSRDFNRSYEKLVGVAADVEATLDFPEDELPAAAMADLTKRVCEVQREIESLLLTWDEGHLLREGANVVISGKPNVGKSTLLNTLLGRPRAIVSPIPGTTRDTIEEGFVLDGIPLRLVDTAGLRDSQCEVESEGVRRTLAHMEKADLHLYMIDGSAPATSDDREQVSALDRGRCLVVLNKMDLGQAVRPEDFPGYTCVCASLLNGSGVQDIRHAMAAKLEVGIDMAAPPHAVISERHRRLLLDAQSNLAAAVEILRSGNEDQIVPAIENLRSAAEDIGLITGRSYQDELLDNIFSRFCIGK